MKKRENYWAKDYERKNFNNFDEIKFIFIEDENQQVVSFFNGDYDILSLVDELSGGLKNLMMKIKRN